MKITDLSPRELEILELLSKGSCRQQIAEKLAISKLTYDSYRKNIRVKLGIKSQADWGAVLFALSVHKQENTYEESSQK